MNPEILGTKQSVRLGPGNTPVSVLLVTWKAGPYGPFDEQSTWDELSNGTLLRKLQDKARALGNLPQAQQTA